MKNILFAVMSIFFVTPLFATAQTVKTNLALNWKAEPQFGGFYQAAQDGSFKKQNLEVQVLEGGSGTPTVQMLANGKVEFAVVSGEEILINNERNPNRTVVGIFAAFQTNPQMIMCHPESGFKNLAEVFASSVTLSMQNGLTYVAYLKQKYPALKAKIVPALGGVTSFLSLKDFCQQGFATSEPLVVEKAGQKSQVFLVSEEGFNPYTTVVAVNSSTLKSKPELVKKFVAAIREGWQNYLKNPENTNKMMSAINKAMDADSFKKSAQIQIPLILPAAANVSLGTMSEDRWDSLIGQLKSLKILRKDLKASDQFRNL